MRKKGGAIIMWFYKPAMTPLYDYIENNNIQVSDGGSYVYKPAMTPLYDYIENNNIQVSDGGSYVYL
ncbi:hypothetical protein I6G31_13290 [Proteus penneri]|uniref:hypothetical protein n=1 Tax=Proteus penneri TaxID=102862 RepID=UPI001472F02C|nr:hypothetical protein [Proteus penneri]QPT33070.1 hypothetical protein I6G31_13290 [Proteus penneri]